MQDKMYTIAVGPLATNCWIYTQGDESEGSRPCIVIDPGSESNRIISFLKKRQLRPVSILLTHGHFDHIGAMKSLIAEYGDATVAMHESDEAMTGKKFKIDRHLSEGDIIGSLAVLHLPGHSSGSIGLWDKEAGVLFSGDTLFYGTCGRTDLPGGSEVQMIASLKRLFTMDGSIKVYPGHDRSTTIADEASRGFI